MPLGLLGHSSYIHTHGNLQLALSKMSRHEKLLMLSDWVLVENRLGRPGMGKDSQNTASVYLKREELRELWEVHHGVLDESQRRRFDSRPEIPWLVWIPATHVRPAVANARKLQRILRLAQESHQAQLQKEVKDKELSLSKQTEPFVVKKPKNPSRTRIN